MDYLLLNLPLLTVGAYSLVVDAVLFTIPRDVDSSYEDDGSCVVFIFDTTHSLVPFGVVCNSFLLTSRRKWVVAVAVALANLALSVVQEKLRLVLTGSLPTLLLSLLLSIVERC